MLEYKILDRVGRKIADQLLDEFEDEALKKCRLEADLVPSRAREACITHPSDLQTVRKIVLDYLQKEKRERALL